MQLNSLFGFKVGSTQLFDQESRNVVPASVISFGTWFVLQVKTQATDGYDAFKVGAPRKRYLSADFDSSWLKNLTKFFLHVREIRIDAPMEGAFVVGHKLSLSDLAVSVGKKLHVQGTSKALGFQGVVKRHGFSGGNRTHGCRFGRIPGSIGCIRGSEGEVFKGKKLPGRMGGKTVTVQGLSVVDLKEDGGVFFVKGAVPGKKGSLLKLSVA